MNEFQKEQYLTLPSDVRTFIDSETTPMVRNQYYQLVSGKILIIDHFFSPHGAGTTKLSYALEKFSLALHYSFFPVARELSGGLVLISCTNYKIYLIDAIVDLKSGLEILIAESFSSLIAQRTEESIIKHSKLQNLFDDGTEEQILHYLADTKNLNPNTLLETGDSLLERAVIAGHLKVVQKLIDLGATPKGLFTAIYNSDTEMLQLLVHANAELEILNSMENIPLAEAVIGNHLDAVKILIEGGAQVEHKDQYNRTVLDRAKKKLERGLPEFNHMVNYLENQLLS